MSAEFPDVTVTDYRNMPIFKLATSCWSRGYTPARTGMAIGYKGLNADSLTGSVGLLFDNPDQATTPRRFFGLIGPKKLRRIHLGDIWVSNEHRGASATRWVFEVYGEDTLKRAEQLAAALSAEFQVKIEVRLVQTNIKYETVWSDYGL